MTVVMLFSHYVQTCILSNKSPLGMKKETQKSENLDRLLIHIKKFVVGSLWHYLQTTIMSLRCVKWTQTPSPPTPPAPQHNCYIVHSKHRYKVRSKRQDVFLLHRSFFKYFSWRLCVTVGLSATLFTVPYGLSRFFKSPCREDDYPL